MLDTVDDYICISNNFLEDDSCPSTCAILVGLKAREVTHLEKTWLVCTMNMY